MILTVEEASEVPLLLIYLVTATPYAWTLPARRVVLLIKSSLIGANITINQGPVVEGLDLLISDVDGGALAHPISFGGTLVSGVSSTITLSGGKMRFFYAQQLAAWIGG